jgi:hypothetical protein
MSISVDGLESTLKALKKVQPEVQKQFFKDAKKILKPVVDEAKKLYPYGDPTKKNGAWPSGISRTWAPGGRGLFPYVQSAAVRGISVKTSLSKKKDAVLTIVNKDAAASIVEFAGTNPNALSRALDGWGNKPRVMWRAYENNAGQVETEMKQSVDEVMAQINQLTKALVL